MTRDDRVDERARTSTTAFTCQGCGATFATRRELHLHNEETHGGGSTGGSTDEPPGGGVDEPPAGGGFVGP
jgi:hypothetical protein